MVTVVYITILDVLPAGNLLAVLALHAGEWALVFNVRSQLGKVVEWTGLAFLVRAAQRQSAACRQVSSEISEGKNCLLRIT